MRKLSDCFLYGILDLAYVRPERSREVASDMIAGGVDLVQLRGKEATVDELTRLADELHKVTAAASVPLIINDHAEIACQIPVEGVHLGQDDESIKTVRDLVRRPVWVGKSTHSIEQAIAANQEGADYIGFGPIYSTPTKPDYSPIGLTDVGQVHHQVPVPIFCIGGIKLHNLPKILAAGGKRAVIVSGLLQADDVTEYARACKNLLNTAAQPAAEANQTW